MSRKLFVPLASALALLVLACSSVRSQDGTLDELETAFEKKERATNTLRGELFKGEKQANPASMEHREAIDAAAILVTYPLHWLANNRKAGVLNSVVKQFSDRLYQLGRAKDKSAVAMMQRLYCKAVAERARKVVVAGPAIASVNASRVLYLISAREVGRDGFWQSNKDWVDSVLPRLRGDTAETLASICTDLVTSPRVNEGVKYYLLKCLADLLAFPEQDPPLLKKETRDKAILAALPVLRTKKVFARNTPREVLEGWKILRAQALLVLAQSEADTVDKEKVALFLARAAAGDVSISPPCRLDERIAGALGLARMVSRGKAPGLNADYAAHQVAAAVAIFALEAGLNIAAKTSIRVRPWKADAARLLQAVESMSSSKDAHVKAVVAQCRPILAKLEAGEVATAATDLQDWVTNTPPPAKSLIKGDETSTVKPFVIKE